MRSPTAGRRKQTVSLTVAMTPMIDVVFLLLIFFLCTASFQTPEADLAASLLVETSGPGTSDPFESLPQFDELTIVGASRGGTTTWSINQSEPTSDAARIAGLLGELAEIDRTAPVTIEPDGPTPLAEVIRIYDAARLAGFNSVRLAASAESIQGVSP